MFCPVFVNRKRGEMMLNPEIAHCKMVIYKIENKTNGKIYVGQTRRTLAERISEHKRKSRRLSYIDRAIKKYGIETFEITILEICDTLEKLNEREIFWIRELNSKYPNGYNLTDGGRNFCGYVPTPELRALLSKIHTGRKASKETCAKRSASLKGHPVSIATRQKLSKSHTGKVMSAKARANMSKARKGKKLSESHKLHMAESAKNKRIVRCMETNTIFNSIKEAANWAGVSRCCISETCSKRQHTAGGYHWEYVN